MARAAHQAGVLGLSAQDGAGGGPMCGDGTRPSVLVMNNPTALITGASRGLGRALAAGLAREGFDLIIDARDRAALDAAAGALRAAGPAAQRPGSRAVTAIPGDVTDPAHRAALADAARAAGRLDLLVNNAGTLGASPLPPL